MNRVLTAAQCDADDRASVAVLDEQAFGAFYERTSRTLWVYLYRVTGDRHAADDLLQETYYRFCRAGASYDSESHRRNALFHIATNLTRDLFRRRGHINETSIDDHAGLHGEAMTAVQLEARTDVGRAMERLKPQQREMLWLAYALGSSHEEIAAITGVTRGSVKALLLRARRKLAALLSGPAAATSVEPPFASAADERSGR